MKRFVPPRHGVRVERDDTGVIYVIQAKPYDDPDDQEEVVYLHADEAEQLAVFLFSIVNEVREAGLA